MLGKSTAAKELWIGGPFTPCRHPLAMHENFKCPENLLWAMVAAIGVTGTLVEGRLAQGLD
jgi:hypothetical protein